MGIIKSVSEWMREQFGMDPKTVVEASEAIETAMAGVKPVVSKEVSEKMAVTVKNLNHSLLGLFPLKGYIEYLQKTPEFPSFETTLADVVTELAATKAGVPHNLPNYAGYAWAADYVACRSAVTRYATMLQYHGQVEMAEELKRVRQEYEWASTLANATANARIIAAFNAGCDCETKRLKTVESAKKIKAQCAGDREVCRAEAEAGAARRGKAKSLDERVDELKEIAAVLAEQLEQQAERSNARVDRLEVKLGEALDAFIAFTQMRQSSKVKPTA
jgi:hypothetical protein